MMVMADSFAGRLVGSLHGLMERRCRSGRVASQAAARKRKRHFTTVRDPPKGISEISAQPAFERQSWREIAIADRLKTSGEKIPE